MYRCPGAIGLGIAGGDAIYGLIAALGLVSVSHFMLAYDKPLHIIAGLFLLYLGIRTMLQKVPADNGNNSDTTEGKLGNIGHSGAIKAFASALLLTLTRIGRRSAVSRPIALTRGGWGALTRIARRGRSGCA